MKTTAGEYTLVVSAIGYQTVEKKVKLAKGERIKVNVTIAPAVKELGEVLVTTSGVGRVNQSAFNAVAIDAKKLHNSTQTLAGALTKSARCKTPRIRWSGIGYAIVYRWL